MSVGIAFAGGPFPVHGSSVFGAGVKVARVVFLGHIRMIRQRELPFEDCITGACGATSAN
jgi:hypothetical protein